MSKGTKKQFRLDGLDCSHCASKIENHLRQLNGVMESTINFSTKTLSIEIEANQDIDAIKTEIKNIVNKFEPHVTVKEKHVIKPAKRVFTLKGLGCADCAAKIENKIQSLPDVSDAIVDFASKKLYLEINSKANIQEVIHRSSEIAQKIEPDIKLMEFNKEAMQSREPHEENISKKEIIFLGIGALIFFIALLIKDTPTAKIVLHFISYVIVGRKVLLKAFRNILNGQIFDENFLMAIASIGAFAIHEYPEGVAVMLFYQVGEMFQDMAVNRSRKSISALMDIRPDFAHLKKGDELAKVSPEVVSIGDIIVVKPGEKVPLDGKVIEGQSMLDTSALTGESLLRDVAKDSMVLSGSINTHGVLSVEVTKAFGESTVSKILDLVENASSKKAPTENFITKFARYYTPFVVISAAALAIIPPLLLPSATFSEWINRALVFLVVSCPCALVISIPLSFFGGIGGASRNGILIKGSNYLEALNKVETIVFDKTGTLTKGIFKVTQIKPSNELDESMLLEYAAHAESYSNHPIAYSILEAYGKNINQEKITNYNEVSGYGIKATIKGKMVLVGNARWMEKQNISFNPIESTGTIVYIAIDEKYMGSLVISDEIKDDSYEALKTLKSMGIKKRIMLTGDRKAVAEKIGSDLGLDSVYSELLPDEKVAILERLEKEKASKNKLIFVGDGINDAPVLARSDIGVAMGGLGSDAAIEAADIVLMTDEPLKLVHVIEIAKRTRKIVWENIIFALGIKGIVLLLGAVGIATMWEAVFADVGVAIIAILNAMRVLKN